MKFKNRFGKMSGAVPMDKVVKKKAPDKHGEKTTE